MKKGFEKKLKQVGLSVATSFAAAFMLGVSAYPVIAASAEEVPEESVAVIETSKGSESAVHVSEYKVAIDVNTDSTIDISENITVEFLSGVEKFSRSIPKAIEEVSSVSVVCEGNEEFTYEVVPGENVTFVDCYGGVEVGNVWTYVLNYTVAIDVEEIGDELVFGIVSEGWSSTIESVEAEINLPEAIVNYDLNSVDTEASLSDGGKTITVSANKNEAVAVSDAISVRIVLPGEALMQDFSQTIDEAEKWIWPSLLTWILGIFAALICVVLWIAL